MQKTFNQIKEGFLLNQSNKNTDNSNKSLNEDEVLTIINELQSKN